MRRLADAASAVVALAIAIGFWSLTPLVTTASGVTAVRDIGLWRSTEQSPAAAIADRFPTATETFRPVNFIRQADTLRSMPMLAARGKGDRQALIAQCARPDWLSATAQCFAATPVTLVTPAKPAVKAERPVAPIIPVTFERRIGESTSELVRTPAVAVAAAPPVASAAASPPSCRQNLAAAAARLERAVAHVSARAPADGTDICASYRRDFFDVVKAREVTFLCKSGAERDQDLGRIDVAVENINGAIALRCGS